MFPSIRSIGTKVADVAAIVVPWPTEAEGGYDQGELGVLVVNSSNEAIATPSGWIQFPDSPQGIGVGGAVDSVRLAAFWRRAASNGEAAVTVADTGNHQQAFIFVLRDVVAVGNPDDVTAGDTAAAGTAVSIPGDTTTAPDCLILALLSDGFDLTGARFSGAANASLTNVTEQHDSGTIQGTGGGLVIVTGRKATAGVVSATTGTLANASQQARIMIAIKGRQAGVHSGHNTGHTVGHTVGHQ